MNIRNVVGLACPTGMRKAIAIGAIAVSLTACGGGKWGFPYRIDVQQGNWITASQVEQLEAGMTREQVRFVLGTPTLQDIFYSDRWEYPYYFKPGYGDEELRTFTVWFEGDQLVRWDGSDQPDRQPFERADSGAPSLDPSPRDERSGIPMGNDEILQSPEPDPSAEPMPVPGPGGPQPDPQTSPQPDTGPAPQDPGTPPPPDTESGPADAGSPAPSDTPAPSTPPPSAPPAPAGPESAPPPADPMPGGAPGPMPGAGAGPMP